MNKNIFKYNNGERDVFGDPILIETRFFKTLMEQGNPESILKNLGEENHALREDAINKFVPAVMAAFKVKPLDEETGDGLTVSQMIDLYSDYFQWYAGVKKNTEDTPNSSQSTPDSLPTAEPGEPADSPQTPERLQTEETWEDQSETKANEPANQSGLAMKTSSVFGGTATASKISR